METDMERESLDAKNKGRKKKREKSTSTY